MQGGCSSTLEGVALTVNMVGWCNACQQSDIVLDPTLLEVLAVIATPQVNYRQVGQLAEPSRKIGTC